MKKQHSIKYVVNVMSITKPLQKIHFTVRHPEDTFYLSGIAALTSCPFIPSAGNYDLAGSIALAIPNKGDVFYTEDIKMNKGDFRDIAEQKVNTVYIESGFAFTGKRYTYFDTDMPITDALMEAYYEDLSVSFINVRAFSPYKLTLYLRYELKILEPLQNPIPC